MPDEETLEERVARMEPGTRFTETDARGRKNYFMKTFSGRVALDNGAYAAPTLYDGGTFEDDYTIEVTHFPVSALPVAAPGLNLPAIMARANAAKLGPWSADEDSNEIAGEPGWSIWGPREVVIGTWYSENGIYGSAGVTLFDEPTAEFVAHAREDIPAMAAALAAQSREIAWLRANTANEGCQRCLNRETSTCRHCTNPISLETGDLGFGEVTVWVHDSDAAEDAGCTPEPVEQGPCVHAPSREIPLFAPSFGAEGGDA